MERIQPEPGNIQLFPRTFEQGLHPLYVEKSDFTFFCMLAGINAAEIPQTWPDRIKIPVLALQEATYWWYEYRHEALANQRPVSHDRKGVLF